MATINFDALKRTKTRSFISDPDLLEAADKILLKKNTNVSAFCHQKLVDLVRKEQAKKTGNKDTLL